MMKGVRTERVSEGCVQLFSPSYIYVVQRMNQVPGQWGIWLDGDYADDDLVMEVHATERDALGAALQNALLD